MEPKTKILNNPSTGADIINYPILEAVIDVETGDVVMDSGNGQPKTTGRTLEWSIIRGQTLKFPAYVAKYLLYIYPFLRETKVAPKDAIEASGVDKTTITEEQ